MAAAAAERRRSRDGGGAAAPLRRDALPYTRSYCEENVWRLLDTATSGGGDADEWRAVWLSSQRDDPCAEKRNGPFDSIIAVWDGQETVFWDYHVVALHCPAGGRCVVYDHDSQLGGWPQPVGEWARTALRAYTDPRHRHDGLSELWLRVCPAPAFLASFASDRAHMRDAAGGWHYPPPPQPCIQPAGVAASNMSSFINMGSSAVPGKVMPVDALLAEMSARESVPPRRRGRGAAAAAGGKANGVCSSS